MIPVIIYHNKSNLDPHLGWRVVGGQGPQSGQVLVVLKLAQVENTDGGVHKCHSEALLGSPTLVDGQQVPDDDKIRQELQQRRCADSFSLDIRAGFDAAPAM